MTDTELLNFVERRGIQIWPQRKSRYGPVGCWYVQDNGPPFRQLYGNTVRDALTKLKKALEDVP